MGSRAKRRSGAGGGSESMSLQMECYDIELSPEQKEFYSKEQEEFSRFQAKFQNLLQNRDVTVEHGNHISFLEFFSTTQIVPRPPDANSQSPSSSNIIVQPTNNGTGNYQLVVDSRLGVIVGSSPGANQMPNSAPRHMMGPNSVLRPQQTGMRNQVATRGGKSKLYIPIKNTNLGQPPQPMAPPRLIRGGAIGMSSGMPSPRGHMRMRGPKSRQALPPPLHPHPTQPGPSVGGGGGGGVDPTVVDLTDDDSGGGRGVPADSKEVAINKISGKTFPSLVVVARPHLTSKDCPPVQAQAERQCLDAKVKKVLMVAASSFTEWLLQNGLLRCEQSCQKHNAPDGSPVKLKLGMYSETAKFPFSGGYVWISECCPSNFVSVFSGSIFEGAPHPPTTLLKLLYHWACHTSIQNVTQWVKVDNLYVKSFYTFLRAVCTAAVHNKCTKMGGNRKKIQVGVISLGTTTQDGSTRQVKVEVLGVLDPETKYLRIRAIEPIQEGEKNYKKRFMKILEPLQHWVDKDSMILTDFTVDKGTLVKMGYHKIYQVSANDSTPNNKYSNHTIMDYLRKIVPRMFQNTLSLLSRAIIQQFLDELVWRERWGQIPSKAFDTIIEHIAEQTKIDTGGSLVNRLGKIAANPFKNWKYDRWAANCKFQVSSNNAGGGEAESAPVAAAHVPSVEIEDDQPAPSPSLPLPTIDNLPIAITQVEASTRRGSSGSGVDGGSSLTRIEKHPPSLQAATIPLDPYYYGTLHGEPDRIVNNKPFRVKCDLCGFEVRNNIQLMDHLIQHALNKTKEGDQKDICRLCCKVCPSQAALKTHHLQVHREGSNLENWTNCKICSVRLRDRLGLVTHMTKTHYELEMPYSCQVCGFRTSVWEAMVKHFYAVHNGGEDGVCPYCFRVVKFSRNGEVLVRNQYFFMSHIQKHQLPSLVRKCTRCFQWFINKDLKEQHEATAHFSCKDLPGVEREEGEGAVLMPAPLTDPLPLVGSGGGSKGARPRYLQNTANFKAANFRSVKLDDSAHGTECAECEHTITEDHFVGVLSCTRCSYRTCCSRAMAEHNSSSHMSWTPRYCLGRPTTSPLPLVCVGCRFSSANPSIMACHLAIECRGYYCVPEDSPKLMSIGESGKTILNSLGLVRKGSDDSSSQSDSNSAQERGTPMEGVEEQSPGEAMAVDSSPQPEPMLFD